MVLHNTLAPKCPLDVLSGVGTPTMHVRGGYQTTSVLESIRFLDSEHHFSAGAVDAVLRAGVQHTEPAARKMWYDEIRRCRRRHQIPGLARGVCDAREGALSYFVANLPSSALALAALLRRRACAPVLEPAAAARAPPLPCAPHTAVGRQTHGYMMYPYTDT